MTAAAAAAPTPKAAPRARPLRGKAQRPATIEDWLAIPEEKRAELINGRIVYHAFPGPKHGFSQGDLFAQLRPYSRRGGGSGGGSGGGGRAALGGWWLSLEVDMKIGPLGCRPDVVGWRRDKHPRAPELDARGVVTEIPDFICEVLSNSTARYDQGEKRAAYFDAGVAHYWLIDPTHQTLTVLDRTDLGYVVVRVAGPGEAVHAAPFEKVDVVVADLFMDDEEPSPAAETAPPTGPPAAAPGAKPRARPKQTRRR